MANILKESARGIQPIAIEDEFLSVREIFVTEQIDADTSNELLKKLMFLERDGCGREVTLYINSPGGEVISGLAVYDYISMMRSPVRTVCIGTAASMGAIPFPCGEKAGNAPAHAADDTT